MGSFGWILGDAFVVLDAGEDIEFHLLVLFVELATKLFCGRFKGQLFRKICDWYTGIRHVIVEQTTNPRRDFCTAQLFGDYWYLTES